MPATLHNSLIHVAHQVVHILPSPVLRALDAWSLRVARRRALQRQLKWQQQQKAVTPQNSAGAAVYHLKPWRD